MKIKYYNQYSESELASKEFEAGALYLTTDTKCLYLDPIVGGVRTLIGGSNSSDNVDLTGYATEQWVQEGFQPKGEYLTEAPVQSVNGKTGVVSLSAADVGALPNTYTPADDETIIEHSEKLDVTNLAYATCDTASDTAEKVVTISGNDHWKLNVGSVVMIYFTNSNSASNVTINVNGTGAYPIWYNNAEYVKTGTSYTGYARRIIKYMFNGTHWVWIGSSYDANTTYKNAALGHGYATCSTEESTAEKVGTLTSYELILGGIVAVRFTNAVPDNATLNINNKGAKNMFYRGAAITAGVIKAGDTATFVYDGTQYQLISIDRWQNDVTTLQNTLNGISLGIHTDGLVYIFINGSPIGSGIDISGGEIYGYVDSQNTIIVKGSLSDGTYTVKYEMDDGTTIDIGSLDVDNNTYWSITNTLTGCISDNTATLVTVNSSYSATISAISGYVLSSIVVTMGGTDISATAVSDNTVTITSVTGDIVITAVANVVSGNLADPTSTDWLTDKRLATGYGYAKDLEGSIFTNYIPAKMGDTLRVKGLNLHGVSSNSAAIGCYSNTDTSADSSGKLYAYQEFVYTGANGADYSGGAKEQVTVDSDGVYTYTILLNYDGTQLANSETVYIRISAPLVAGYTAEDVIITINEEITTGDSYSITNTLTGCISDNTATRVIANDSYSATISAKSGYELSSVVVTMGGEDISATAVSSGIITITSVTGDIVITAVADVVSGNLADPTSADWQADKRLASSYGYAKDLTGFTFTNYIPALAGDVLRVKGLNLYGVVGSTPSSVAIYTSKDTAADSTGRLNAYQRYRLTSHAASTSSEGAKEQVAKNGDVFTYTILLHGDGTQTATSETAYARISAPLMDGYTADDVIITINEEIADSGESYTNVLPLSVDESGNDYVGTNGEDGYKSGYKISVSSASESSASGAFVSGFIPINGGKIIRIKNITASDTISINNIVFYNANKTKVNGFAGSAGAFTTVVKVDDGVYTIRLSSWFTTEDLPTFFRFSCGGITDETIVTIDEEIV